jgi:RHS repeat-associated protein
MGKRNRQYRTARRIRRPCFIESLEDRRLFNADWQNPGQSLDVDDDLTVSPLDVLVIVNDLNRNGSRLLEVRPPSTSGNYLDASGDGYVDPLDVLDIINALNAQDPLLAAKLSNDSGSSEIGKLDRITNDPSISGQISYHEHGLVLQVGVGLSPTQYFDISNKVASSSTFNLTATEIVSSIGAPLIDGSNVYTFRVFKKQALIQEIGVEFELDTTAPPPASFGLDTASRLESNNPALTRLSQITIRGTAQPGQPITLAPVGLVTTAASDGSFNYNDLMVAEGLNPFTARIEDIAGNVAATSLSISKVSPSPGSGGSIILAEGSQWIAEHAFLIDLENPKGSRRLSFNVAESFDRSDLDVLVGDLLQVYLVDPMNPGTTFLDRGREGEALFSLSETGADFLPGLVTFNGTMVTVDLTSLGTVKNGLLVFQLINGDADENSIVSIGSVLNEVDEVGVAAPVFPGNTLISQPGTSVDVSGYNVTPKSAMQAIVNNVRVDGEAGTYLADLTLRNTGNQVSRALAVRFNNLPADVVLRNASGFDASGRPYLNLAPAILSGGLDVNATTSMVELSISNPNAARFELDIDILSAGPNRPPTLTPISTQTVMPGGRLEIQLNTSDPDSDRITYQVQADRPLLRGSIDSGNGVLLFSPRSADLGTYQVNVTATDGAATAVQSFTLKVVADPITTTRISGRILDVDESPISGMRVELGGVQGLTQGDGSFTLDLGFGPLISDTLKIRGELFVGAAYPFIAEKLPLLLEHDVQLGVNNFIARPIFLPKLDIANGVTISPTSDTMVTSAALPGTSVFVAAGTLMNQQGTPFTAVLSITEVPRDLTPAALPEGLIPDLVVTVQPGEMVFSTPAPMTFPNRSGWLPGTLMNLWSINPTTGQFDDVGDMRVSTDGTIIETISGGVRNSSWHFPAPPPPTQRRPENNPRDKDDACNECEASANGTSQVLLHSGALMETHELVSYQSLGQTRGLTLTYDSLRADPRPIVHFGYDNLRPSDGIVYATMQVQRGAFEFELPGFSPTCDNLSIGCDLLAPFNSHFWGETLGGLDVALQSDLRQQPSGRYDYKLSLGVGRIDYSDAADPRLGGASSVINGQLISVNSIQSPFGAGWGVNGLQQIVENPDGSLLLIDGDGGEQIYETASGTSYTSPPGDFSIMEKLPNGRFRQTLPDQTVLDFNLQGMLVSVTDRNNNATSYLYDQQGLLQKIIDPVGLETRLDYLSGRLAKIADPAGRITAMQYDAVGNLTRISDPDGSYRIFLYDGQHHMIGEVDQRGASEKAVYGFHGRVLSVTRKDGTQLFFDPLQVQGLLPPEATTEPFHPPVLSDLGPAITRYTDGSGNTVAKRLDKAGQETTASDGVGAMRSVERDGNNLVTKVRNGRGQLIEFEYDTRGNPTKVTDDVVRNAPVGELLFPGEYFSLSSSPRSVTTADFNGDGHTDVVLANTGTNDVSVLLGNSDGTFPSEQLLVVGRFPFSVITGDFNGDGRIDLAVPNYGSSDISILMGNGDGTFATERRVATGISNNSSATGDFDGDGQLDLVVASTDSRFMVVLLGNGDGTFDAQQRVEAGSGPLSMTTGDFDGDGQTDLAFASFLSNDVSVSLGNGDGTFATERHFAAGARPRSIASADFNGDGRSDLVVANEISSDVSVLLGNGNGTFADPQDFAAGNYPQSVTTGDLNGDGRIDLAVANSGSNDLSVLLGNGDGSFAPQQHFAAGIGPTSLTTGDFNSDGRIDLATASNGSNDLSVLFGNGDGTFGAERFEVGGRLRSLTTGDFNGDGRQDLATSNSGSNEVSVLLSNGDGTFDAAIDSWIWESASFLAAGDFNGDGRIDIAGTVTGFNEVLVLLGNGDGTYGSPSSVVNRSRFVTTADFNGDGRSDLAVTSHSANDVSILLGKSDGTFADEQFFHVGSGPSSVTTGDLNGDGRIDLAVANSVSNDVSVLLGNGDGTFAAHQLFTVGNSPISVTTGDFNGDGRIDLAAANTSSRDVSMLLGNGDGTFSVQQRFAAGTSPSYLTTGDFNGDGRSDLAVASDFARYYNNDVSVLMGNSDGTLSAQRRFAAGIGSHSLATADFNGDGWSDIASANADNVSVLLNESSAGASRVQSRVSTYDGTFSQVTSSTDELGRQTRFEIDPTNGNRLSTRQIVGQHDSLANAENDDLLTRFTYTQLGLIDWITDPMGRITDYDYDGFGRLISIRFAVGAIDEVTQRFEYDAAGNQSAIIDGNGNRTEYFYDALNRMIRIVKADPDGAGPLQSPVTNLAYDARGNLVNTIDATGSKSTSVYDSRDRLILTRDQLGNETMFTYDAAGNQVASIDPNGNTTRFRYDARNRQIASIDPNGGVTSFRYDSDDNLQFLTDPNGNRTRFVYDSRNRLVREEDPLGEEIIYKYDAVNNLTSKTDRSNRQTKYAYDELNRLVTETWVSGGNRIHYSHDKTGNLTSVADRYSSIAITYDNRSLAKTVDNVNTPNAPRVVLNYAYDDVGNVLSVVDTINGTAGATTGHLYDALNRMTRTTQVGSGLADKRVDLAYNPLGQFASIERFSDLGGTQRVVGTSYTYDTLNRLTGLAHNNTAGPVSFYNFTYDSASRITRIADIDGATDYAYDDRDQLTGADRSVADARGDETYTYDANGNRITSHLHNNGYVTGPGNRLLSDGTYNYAYDKEGNLVKRTEIASGNYRDFHWDFRNRLIAITDKTAANVATQKVSFSYDVFNRRISRGVDTTPQDAVDAVFTHFIYDGDDVILDFVDSDGSGPASPTLDERYFHGPAVDQVLAKDNAAGSVQWHLTDHLGTVRDLVDNTGVVVNHIIYDSFGNVVSQTNATVDSRYLFTGRERDEETDLQYYRARYYVSAFGRFISEDPLRFGGADLNLGRYVENVPNADRDPSGTLSGAAVLRILKQLQNRRKDKQNVDKCDEFDALTDLLLKEAKLLELELEGITKVFAEAERLRKEGPLSDSQRRFLQELKTRRQELEVLKRDIFIKTTK